MPHVSNLFVRSSLPLALVALGLVSGCNRKGTCVPNAESKTASACVINVDEGMCSKYGTPTTFYPESGAAGVLRCKSAGFDSRSGPARSSTELDYYYKPQ